MENVIWLSKQVVGHKLWSDMADAYSFFFYIFYIASTACISSVALQTEF